MAITTLSSREFNQDAAKAKRAARKGPVFITDRGRPAHVLLSIEEYQQITNKAEEHSRPVGNARNGRNRWLILSFASNGGRVPQAGRLVMMYVLDTNVISELRKASIGKADRQVAAWANSVPLESMFLSSVCILEMELGTLMMESRDDAMQGAILRCLAGGFCASILCRAHPGRLILRSH
jgi:prevent-host-death family protein